MRGQRKNPRKAVQPFENKKRKIDIFKNYEANGVEKIQRKLEIFSTLISKKTTLIIKGLRAFYLPDSTKLRYELRAYVKFETTQANNLFLPDRYSEVFSLIGV